jgi:hypothetical protein
MDEETTTSRDMFRIESLLPDTFDMTDEQPTSCRDSTQIANLLPNTLDIMEENSAASRVTPQVANLLPINLDITNKKATTTRDTSQLANLHPNTFYLTFNAPAKNEYVCLPHLSTPPLPSSVQSIPANRPTTAQGPIPHFYPSHHHIPPTLRSPRCHDHPSPHNRDAFPCRLHADNGLGARAQRGGEYWGVGELGVAVEGWGDEAEERRFGKGG